MKLTPTIKETRIDIGDVCLTNKANTNIRMHYNQVKQITFTDKYVTFLDTDGHWQYFQSIAYDYDIYSNSLVNDDFKEQITFFDLLGE